MQLRSSDIRQNLEREEECEMTPKEIEISCKGSDVLKLHELTNFQGPLKSMDNDGFQKLKTTLIKYGMVIPIFIWKNGNTNFIIDGHQRVKVLKTLQYEGFKIPMIPVDYVFAKTEKEAKKKLLIAVSQYGVVNRVGLDLFLMNTNLSFEDIEMEMSLPGIKSKSMKATYKEEELQPYKKAHILLSFSPVKMMEIQTHLQKILQIEGVECEQSAS